MTIDMTFERREELIRRDERAEGRAEGIAEGIVEGRSEGLAEGIQKTQICVYEKCLSLGMDKKEAIEISGITPEILNTLE